MQGRRFDKITVRHGGVSAYFGSFFAMGFKFGIIEKLTFSNTFYKFFTFPRPNVDWSCLLPRRKYKYKIVNVLSGNIVFTMRAWPVARSIFDELPCLM